MGASGDMLSTGTSALLAFQRSLATTSHNISNVNTEGYNRQTVSMISRTPQASGNGFVGAGVEVVTVRRAYNDFINTQVLVNSSSNGRLDSYSRFATQVDNLMADPGTGLAPGVTDFFNAAHDVANDPTSIQARQVMLSQGQSLVDRFNNLDSVLKSFGQGVTQNLTNEVTTLNGLASSVAKLNVSISTAGQNGQPPNDLLDQRDALIEEIAQHVAVTTTTQDDGSKNIFIGNGQSLVIGNTSATLSVIPNQYDASQSDISLTQGTGSVVVTSSLTGGTIGGLIEFRDQVLNPTRNALGQMAIGLAQSFNAQHNAGMDLNGNLGRDIFSVAAPQVLNSTANTGSGVITAQISDISALTKDDYTLQYNGSNYLLINNTTQSSQTLGAAGSGPFTVAGMTISESGTPATGDRFTIHPTRNAAGGIAMALSDPRSIAAAAPIITNKAPANTGTGSISSGTVTDISNSAFTSTAGALSPPISIVFTSPTTYNIVNNTTSAVLDTGTYAAGTGKDVFPSDNLSLDYGYQVRITGAPAAGDTFGVAYNTGGVGDNRNALVLTDLQIKGILDGGTASYQQAYGQLVAKVGTQTHSAQINSEAQSKLLAQAKDQRASLSGVNLDEEAASLLRFQQAYQAAAQVISTASNLFNTLLSAVRG